MRSWLPVDYRKGFEMKDVITTGYKNKRLTTDQFSAWLAKRNQERQKELFGIEKYIMDIEAKDGFTLIRTYNGSIYTLPLDKNSHNDLMDLIGYKVTLYPRDCESYELEAYFLWDWEKILNPHDLRFLVINKVVEIKNDAFGGSILFENGDSLKVPYKDYEKPYFRASKKMHGEDTFREGYKIDFATKMAEIRSKFLGKFVVYGANLVSVDVAKISHNTEISTYEDTAHYEWVEKDKFKFRQEVGIIKSIATWDLYSVPIYLEDGRIMVFNVWDYLKHIDPSREVSLVQALKKDLQGQTGRLTNFMVVYDGDKRYNGKSMDIAYVQDVESGLILPRVDR